MQQIRGSVGKMPEVSESLTICVRIGSTMSGHEMSREVRIGSTSHVFEAGFCTNLRTVFFDWFGRREFPVKCLSMEGAGDCGSNSFRIFSIFAQEKKSEKILGESD